MRTKTLAALVVGGVMASGMAVSAVSAADLGTGGNCCADLEERIAELEATTVRKGNRKVSLTISGWVSQQLLFWDDGREKNVYVTDPGYALASHVAFTGSAKISSDLSAGYVMYVEIQGNDSLVGINQDTATFKRGVTAYESFWFVKSETLGKISVGNQSGAVDNQAFLVDGSGSSVPANFVLYDNNNFFLVRNDKTRSAVTWGSLATCGNLQIGLAADCEGAPTNTIRYDTPVFSGFSGSASWGEDDIWGVSGRYAGEFNSIKFAAAIAYLDSSNGPSGIAPTGGSNPTIDPVTGLSYRRSAGALQTAAYIQHVPTGLFVYGVYARDYNDSILSPGEIALNGKKKDGDNYYIKVGIRQKWNSLGNTVLYGEYGENNDKQSVALWDAGVTSSNITQWGIGLIQEIDAAAMQGWIVYRNFSADQNCSATATNADCVAAGFGGGKSGKASFQDIDIVKVGALIAF